MPTNTYVALDTQTLTSTAATVTFSSIPQGYTDLVLIASPLVTSSAYDLVVRFNGDTASNYSNTILSGTGSSAISARLSNQTIMYLDYYGVINTTQTNRIINIMNYSNSTTYKTVLSRANNAGSGTDAIVGLWRNTAAITSLVLIAQTGGTFAAGSTFSLYGIKSEEAASKATGGYVTSDANYYYHTFLASGTFTPTTSITADILVVAGGGGGGDGGAGGGAGAGGLLGFNSQSLTAGALSITVGGGGTGGTSVARSTNGADSQFQGLTLVKGGGGGGSFTVPPDSFNNGLNGGSGGGSVTNQTNTTPGTAGSPTSGQGFAGGLGSTDNITYRTDGGGGGAGAAGGNATTTNSGSGGNGSSSYSSWGLATSTGQNVSGTYWYAGGGGGAGITAGIGGSGGGGAGQSTAVGVAGTANTGGGGGGGRGAGGGAQNGGAGGSGIVIVRYAK